MRGDWQRYPFYVEMHAEVCYHVQQPASMRTHADQSFLTPSSWSNIQQHISVLNDVVPREVGKSYISKADVESALLTA